MFKFLILIILSGCFFSSPESLALKFMEKRYFAPNEAFNLIYEGDVSKESFMLQHEEMLRVKDYPLEEIITFKVIKNQKKENTNFITVETTRPHILLIFKSFYQEKLTNNWTSEQIKNEIIKRLKDPNSPQEKISTIVEIEKIKGKSFIRWRLKE